MKRIEDADAAAAAFTERVGELGALLRHHAHDEEADQFPRLRAHVPAGDLAELGRKVEAAKTLAPPARTPSHHTRSCSTRPSAWGAA